MSSLCLTSCCSVERSKHFLLLPAEGAGAVSRNLVGSSEVAAWQGGLLVPEAPQPEAGQGGCFGTNPAMAKAVYYGFSVRISLNSPEMGPKEWKKGWRFLGLNFSSQPRSSMASKGTEAISFHPLIYSANVTESLPCTRAPGTGAPPQTRVLLGLTVQQEAGWREAAPMR